jgi:polysaccharide chain length determinant protein (PEP-CTERM system associated)
MAAEQESNLNQTVERVLGILARRWWWIIGTGVAVALGTIAILYLLPNHYTSDATLLVVQQQVPERYVVPNSTTDITAALEAMKRQILSRTQLLKIVSDFNLYARKRRRLPPEVITELMLNDIDIQPLEENPARKDFTAFKISFTADDPVLAQRVASRLTTLFISENLKTREQQSVTTTAFLHEQAEQKRQAAEAEEKHLSDLKTQFMGELPEQQQGNLGIMAALQTQLQSAESALSHAQEQRVYLESLMNGYLAQATLDLNQLRARRARLLQVYTPQYSAVVQLDKEIARAEGFLRLLQDDSPPKVNGGEASLASAATTEQPAAAQVRSQLNANRLEIENLTKNQAQLNAQIASYQRRLNETPARDQELSAVSRKAEQLRQEYSDLLKKEQESELATNLERNQGGQQFRLVDAPSLPVIPSSPKRLKGSLAGTAAGFSIGLALAFLMDIKQQSFHIESEVSAKLGAPLVFGIPLMPTPGEARQRTRRVALECVAASVLLLALSAAEFYVYRHA